MKKEVMDEINKYSLFNKEERVESYIRTGNNIIDSFFAGYDVITDNGGFPRGKLISIAGQNGIGKSTFVLYCVSLLLRNGYKVIWFDIENALNENTLKSYGVYEYVALDVEDFIKGEKCFFICNPETYNGIIKVLKVIGGKNIVGNKEKVKESIVDLVVIDSYKSIRTEGLINLDNIEDQGSMLSDKRIEKLFFGSLKDICRYYGCCVIGLQQVSLQMKGMLAYLDEPQGSSYLHMHDQRYMMKKIEDISTKYVNNIGERDEKVIGNVVKFLSKKNRYGMRNLVLPLFFGKGVSFVYLFYLILLNNNDIVSIKNNKYEIKNYEVFGLDNVIVLDIKGVYNIIKDNYDKVYNYLIDKSLLYIEKNIDEDVIC